MMKRLEKLSIDKDVAIPGQTSPLDLIRMLGGKAHPVGKGERRPPDSMLAVYRDRLTYTFIMEDEVASIHYDRVRGEIFFKGHNIRHLELANAQRAALYALREVLNEDEEGRAFLSEYEATLERQLTDK